MFVVDLTIRIVMHRIIVRISLVLGVRRNAYRSDGHRPHLEGSAERFLGAAALGEPGGQRQSRLQ